MRRRCQARKATGLMGPGAACQARKQRRTSTMWNVRQGRRVVPAEFAATPLLLPSCCVHAAQTCCTCALQRAIRASELSESAGLVPCGSHGSLPESDWMPGVGQTSQRASEPSNGTRARVRAAPEMGLVWDASSGVVPTVVAAWQERSTAAQVEQGPRKGIVASKGPRESAEENIHGRSGASASTDDGATLGRSRPCGSRKARCGQEPWQARPLSARWTMVSGTRLCSQLPDSVRCQALAIGWLALCRPGARPCSNPLRSWLRLHKRRSRAWLPGVNRRALVGWHGE